MNDFINHNTLSCTRVLWTWRVDA